MKKLMSVVLTLCMVLSLTACSSLPFGNKRPKTAQELAEKVVAVETNGNAQCDGTIDVLVKAKASEGATGDASVSVELPLKMNLSVKMFSEEAFYMTLGLKGNLFGEELDEKMAAYVNDGKTYANKSYSTSGEDYWTYYENENEESLKEIAQISKSADVFNNATMEYDKDTDKYTVTLKASDIFNSEAFKKVMASEAFSSLTENAGDTDINDVFKDVGDTGIVCVYDSDYHLCSLNVKDMAYNGSIDLMGTSLLIDVNCSIDLAFSNHGKITKDDVTVPKDIKESAVAEEEDSGLVDMPFTDVDEPATDEPDQSNPFATGDSVVNTVGTGSFDYPKFNGVVLNPGFDYTIILPYGFTQSTEDGGYSFVRFDSDNTDVYVYFYDKEQSGTVAGLSSGVYGFEFGAYEEADSSFPLTFGDNFKFGSNIEDVRAYYGEPYYEYKSDGYTSYTWKISDSSSFCVTAYDGVHVSSYKFDC